MIKIYHSPTELALYFNSLRLRLSYPTAQVATPPCGLSAGELWERIKVHDRPSTFIEPNALTFASQRTWKAVENASESRMWRQGRRRRCRRRRRRRLRRRRNWRVLVVVTYLLWLSQGKPRINESFYDVQCEYILLNNIGFFFIQNSLQRKINLIKIKKYLCCI